MFSIMRRFPWLRRVGVIFFTLPLMFAGGSLIGELDAVGGVGPLEISRYEFVNQYQQIEENYRRQYGFEETPADLAEHIGGLARSQLVSDYLLRAAVRDKQIEPSNRAVTDTIREMPDFQDESGRFSISLFNDYVRDERELTRQVRDDLRRKPVLLALQSNVVAPVQEKLTAYRRQLRVVEEAVVSVTTTYNIGEQDINAYYIQNRANYQIPEESDWEYVVLGISTHLDAAQPSEEELALAEEELRELKVAEQQRNVRHIYIEGDDDDSQARANDIAVQAQASPEQFGDLAKQYSEDLGSADNGGSLGAVVGGDLPPEMEAALLTLQADEVSDPVAVEGGFSILQVNFVDVLEEISEEDIEAHAKLVLAQDALLESLDQLQEVAHENIGSLEAVATAASVSVQTVTNINRAAALPEDAPDFLALPEVREQLFTRAILEQGETSEAVAISDDEYVLARVSRYVAAGERPPSEVEEEIKGILSARAEIDSIRESNTLPEDISWGEQLTLSLLNETGEQAIPQSTISEIFFTDLSKGLPALAYVPDVQQVRIFRISEIIANTPNEEDEQYIERLMRSQTETANEAAYLETLAERYEIYFDDI